MRKNRLVILIFILILCFSFSAPAEANAGRIVQGLTKTVASIFAIPVSIIQDSSQVIFPVGILTGTARGAMRMVMGTLEGVVDIAAGAAPFAKYAVMFV